MPQLTRRQFLEGMGVSLAGSLMLPSMAFPKGHQEKKLFMHNIHTGEFLKVVFCEKGIYCPQSLEEVNTFFRDRRTNEVKAINPRLLDLIHSIYQATGSTKPIELLSGYRCPKTNAYLRGKSKGVAKNSYHMRGMAADFLHPPY